MFLVLARNCSKSAKNKAKKKFLTKMFPSLPIGVKNCGSEAEPLDVFRKPQTTQVTCQAILVEKSFKLTDNDKRFFPAKGNSSAMGSWEGRRWYLRS